VRPIDAIDVTFDFRDDSAGGDPDTDSPTLRRYHQLLWSKPLPNGVHFVLDATTPYAYLHHRSALGESYLASDSVIATFIRWVRMRSIIAQVSKMENDAFTAIAYTIGGMLVFPSKRIRGKLTLNGARGLSQKSRTDLTSLLSAYGVTTFVNRVRLAKQSSVTATSSSSSTTSMDMCASFFWTIWSTPIQDRSSFSCRSTPLQPQLCRWTSPLIWSTGA